MTNRRLVLGLLLVLAALVLGYLWPVSALGLPCGEPWAPSIDESLAATDDGVHYSTCEAAIRSARLWLIAVGFVGVLLVASPVYKGGGRRSA